MATNQYVNKVVYAGTAIIDLTGDTVEASKVLSGYKAHDKSGAPITGSCTYNADTSDATASAEDILLGQTAYANGQKITGTMPNVGSQTGTISTKAQVVSISAGYHDGSGTVQIVTGEQDKIVEGNIKQGVTILGVTGNYTGSENVRSQSKDVSYTPTTSVQSISITPDLPTYNYLSEVNVTIAPVYYQEVDNAQGGKTVTIIS